MATLYYLNADTGNDSTGDGTSVLPWETTAKGIAEATTGDTLIFQTATNEYGLASFAGELTFEGETTNPDNHKLSSTLQAAVISTTSTRAFTFKNLSIEHNSPNRTAGVYMTGGELTFENCKLVFDYSYFYMRTNGPSWALTMDRCTLKSTNNDTKTFYSNGVTPVITFTNSTFYIDDNTEAFYGGPMSTVSSTIKNCIFITDTDTNNLFDTSVNRAIPEYCCVYDFADNASCTGTGTITSDPLLVDRANGNYNLRPSSPCFDTATLT